METKLPTQEAFKQRSRQDLLVQVFSNVGFIGAIISLIAYIVVVVVLITGFQSQASLTSSILFATINAVFGFIILTFLKLQGISWATSLEENKPIIKEYYNRPQKIEEGSKIERYLLLSSIKDALTKVLGVGISTYAVIYIAIEGLKDYNYLLFALVNILLFISFGFLAIKKSYETYNNKHVPYMLNKIKVSKALKEEQDEFSRQERNDLAELTGTSIKE